MGPLPWHFSVSIARARQRLYRTAPVEVYRLHFASLRSHAHPAIFLLSTVKSQRDPHKLDFTGDVSRGDSACLKHEKKVGHDPTKPTYSLFIEKRCHCECFPLPS